MCPVIGVARAGWKPRPIEKRGLATVLKKHGSADPVALEKLLKTVCDIRRRRLQRSGDIPSASQGAGETAQHPAHYLAISAPRCFGPVVEQLKKGRLHPRGPGDH